MGITDIIEVLKITCIMIASIGGILGISLLVTWFIEWVNNLKGGK